MKKYLYDYIKKIDKIIEKDKNVSDEVIKEHLIKINFFQHERLIHLLVTLFYGLLVLVFIAFTAIWIWFLIIVFMLIIFLLFYIIHYFRLENGVQYLYKQYDELLKIKKH